MKQVSMLALVLVVVGALNWGLVGLFKYDLVAKIFGETFGAVNTASRIVYVAVGVAGLILAASAVRMTAATPARTSSDTTKSFA